MWRWWTLWGVNWNFVGGFFHSSTNWSIVLSAVSTGTQRIVPDLHPAFVHSPRSVFAKSFYPAARPDDWCLGVIAVECVSGRNKFPFLLSQLPQVPQLHMFNAKSDLVKAVLEYCVILCSLSRSWFMSHHPGWWRFLHIHPSCTLWTQPGLPSYENWKAELHDPEKGQFCQRKQWAEYFAEFSIPTMKEFLKIGFPLLPQSFLQKYSVQKGIAHASALNTITVGLGGSGQCSIIWEHIIWKAQEEFHKWITWTGLWFCQKILQTTNDECSALYPQWQ